MVRIYVDVGSYEDSPSHNKTAMQNMGDHCGHAYRVGVEDNLMPLPFVRLQDAKAAGKAIGDAMKNGTVPEGWTAIRQLMLESLAW